MDEKNALCQQAAAQLVRVGHFFFERGWVPATSGNFSARIDSNCMIITVSGWHKGQLSPEGMLLADLEGSSLTTGKRPSAETLLHAALYRRVPEANAVFHTHSVYSTVLSRMLSGELILSDYEVLKAFSGIETHETTVRVPIFPNDQNMGRLAAAVDAYLAQNPDSPGYLIAGHGLYTWGRSVEEACRHVEAFEFLFECEVLRRRLASP
ncbi:methylthioribulose-1-phosphate dehydratase [Nitrosococcus halophilus Nc 4]|uniref:Methylthioribulose-1-phosphate dehydratase n=1 Tax=Nitrosococcus halophilus (strain Nc4) TaxID=472759 RepID=D5BXG3_NITHN|nr:methylthioribulose 1-phosphate dehydratase [Nitrosococcus halophilus]ADE13921.1 methylthioribulose-1-phosphate dehydratase [Nitrosococcus halophilus Nc 4]